MKVRKLLKTKNILINIIIITILNINILLSNCDISISKLSKDVLKDFESYKTANFINKTHFSCDEGTNILPLDKFNDDFCDCIDGSDENSKNLFF